MINISIQLSVDELDNHTEVRADVRHNARLVFTHKETVRLIGGATVSDAIIDVSEKLQRSVDKIIL